MDFETLDFEEIRKFCNIQPIEEIKDLCKSIFESFKQFCKTKSLEIIFYNILCIYYRMNNNNKIVDTCR